MTRCQNCGTHVTDRFARVFGDNDDRVHQCLNCGPNSETADGAAAGLDPSEVTMR